MTFLAYRVTETESGMTATWESREDDQLPAGDVLIDVQYSSVNYKDALSASGNKGVTRAFPHTPGIDAAGVVVSSTDAAFKAGDEVVVFGYDLGMNTEGGYGQRIRVPSAWVLAKPAGISAAETMAWGTAGFTAALSVQKLERAGMQPSKGPVIVTGATGGVGSVAVALLAKLGYDVVALSGKAEQEAWLKELGANRVIGRDEVMALKGKAMAKPLYQAALDTVGGDMVSALIPQIMPEGAVSTCGMIAGVKVEASVFPFILRGVSLLGVDSVEIPQAEKQLVLNKAAAEWKLAGLETMTTNVARSELAGILTKVLNGQGVGRYRVDLNAE
ncbi:YhdH/YhfP family quinone oxidoreductase [Thalassolituus oleivorans]|jgi:putative YhdH/YhfP family quinone oxidoreductase|uniref:Oxidoreductase n=1 Tax=Thalassolituus oleivorans MIL-1 TaxID=1298593 RepID=M5DS40_9GAMM|nr:YhdH/YhfP family quinone oxidoreductase [Thalassolituus oleivorans]MBQ0727938.1 YhdH/YhfP family quinone oxidoreductase [Thalassolituus oleivorans]MBQ0779911.1 YhdH/YhfP family quinone oxidoreductase [Thalassolituus oleivorans]MCA6128662.1 quinone oxidoreductase [Thalassolituus oleivorans 4BN06-13]MDF1640847.1 YhdH/YhfP family quinone oxidoreductase [Thalassolituus oleivorans]CCU72256.1 oxidoreductase [Thalassolituus oleivorans MIL-1]